MRNINIPANRKRRDDGKRVELLMKSDQIEENFHYAIKLGFGFAPKTEGGRKTNINLRN